jgi:hypothetical protein
MMPDRFQNKKDEGVTALLTTHYYQQIKKVLDRPSYYLFQTLKLFALVNLTRGGEPVGHGACTVLVPVYSSSYFCKTF